MAKAKKKATTAQKQPASALTITKGGKEKLSPSQAAFNKLTARIEKLRKDIDRREGQLDEAMTLYGTAIPPLDADLVQQRRQLLTLLWPFYKKRQLPKNLHPHLKALLQDYLSEVLQNSDAEPDEELKDMFRELEGERYETVRKREEKQMQEQMQEMFDDMGVDIDMDETGLNEEEIAKKMAEVHQQMQEKQAEQERKAEERRKTKPKTAKQMEKEKLQQAADEMKQKNISTIYRQLAKLFHPDLERDEDRRLEKEVLMKQLTEAYEAKNLHALLMLELKWIHNENSHLETLSEEKLTVYLQILRQQANELEREKWQMLHQPRYHLLVEKYGFRPLTYPVKAVKEDIENLQQFKATFETDIAAIQSSQALPHLKKMVQEWKTEQEEMNSDIFGDLMQQFIRMQGGR